MAIHKRHLEGLIGPSGHSFDMYIAGVQLAIESNILSDIGNDFVRDLGKLHINLLCD